MWMIFAICGAFFQATESAIKKKALQIKGMNNLIGFISFMVAGLLFGSIHFMKTGTLWHPNLSIRFWEGMTFYAGLNVVAVWFMYRALDNAEFSYLMPFMTLTSLSVVIPPYFILGEKPTLLSLVGIAMIVLGVLYMNYRPKQEGTAEEDKLKKQNLIGAAYFTVTAICFTITPTAAKIAITESSVIFTSFLVHILIGFGFFVLIILTGGSRKAIEFVRKPESKKYFLAIALSGMFAFFENGSINLALSEAPVAYVMALKRLMPLFAFLIGFVYFKEKTDVKRKLIATVLMVLGAVSVILFK